MEWWDIPFIFVGFLIGSYLGRVVSDWIKVKLGWMDPPVKRKKIKRG